MKEKKKCFGTDLGIPCDRDSFAKGMCLMHYKRVWRYGDIEAVKRSANGRSLEYRLKRIGWDVTNSGCWEWRGTRVGKDYERGYGQVSYGGTGLVVSRVSYELWVGPIPDGFLICHRCDNPPCLNPEHLFAGTVQDNSDDMLAKGRLVRERGENASNVKLTEIQAQYILDNAHISASELAKVFGVHGSTIYNVRKGKTWSHLFPSG